MEESKGSQLAAVIAKSPSTAAVLGKLPEEVAEDLKREWAAVIDGAAAPAAPAAAPTAGTPKAGGRQRKPVAVGK